MKFVFKTYEEFLREYHTYRIHACSNCRMPMELTLIPVLIEIDNIKLSYEELHVLECIDCHSVCLPEYSKEIIDGCYQTAIERGEKMGTFFFKEGISQKI